MSLKVKAVQTDLSQFTDAKGNKLGMRFVLKPELYSKLNDAKVIKEAALRSGVSKGVMQACWDAAGEVIKAWATEGHSVALPGLGTMRFGLRSKSVGSVNKVASDLIESRRIIFTPAVDLKEEFKKTSVSITCYDRNGEVVKRVTTDAGEVEDPETGDNTGTQTGDNTNQGGSQNQNPSTGGDNTDPSPNDDDGDEG